MGRFPRSVADSSLQDGLGARKLIAVRETNLFANDHVSSGMSLQYRLRNRSSELDWMQRVRLSERLLVETVDWWCREDGDFPFEQTIAALLLFYSSRYDLKTRETGLRERAFRFVSTPQQEYHASWPQRPAAAGSLLIETLQQILEQAVSHWTDVSMREPTVETVAQQLTQAIISQQYVVFHHHETTKRDFSGFYGTY